MSRASSELSKLEIPLKDNKTSEIADIYKSSTLLLNVYSTKNKIFPKKIFFRF
jgi:hypothetical protein